MQLSGFEMLVLESLIQGDPEEEVLRLQLSTASVVNRNHTGVGLFTNISVLEDAPVLLKSTRYIEQMPKTHLEHPKLAAGAGALLWFEGGRVSCLECYTYDGVWPEDETLFRVAK